MSSGFNPKANCRTEGCSERVKASGFCAGCYGKEWRKVHEPKGNPARVKLSDEQVAEIRKRSSRFESNRAIAADMGISERTVRTYLKAGR